MKCEREGCNCIAQKHHIVRRSQGGLDAKMNYKYLCANHHMLDVNSPHRNIEVLKQYQRELQEQYFSVFDKEEYSLEEIHQRIGYEHKDLYKRFKTVKINENGLYNKEDVIRRLMGGKLLL